MPVVLQFGEPPTPFAIAPPFTSVDVDVRYAARWAVVMENSGLSDITACTFNKSIGGDQFGPESPSFGVMAATVPGPAGRHEVTGINECIDVVRFNFYCAAVTQVTLSTGGV